MVFEGRSTLTWAPISIAYIPVDRTFTVLNPMGINAADQSRNSFDFIHPGLFSCRLTVSGVVKEVEIRMKITMALARRSMPHYSK